ncbi:hypothetical protein Tco_0940474 [Tanacetum coccineum]|uniref:Uncharacterized protein n=1 Tax=Tanacetum coccineum TaxID=301880 RepID=A0ABQ5DNM9_9ASTR
MIWDQNNAFVPKDSEIEKEVIKRPGFNFQQKSSKKRSREDSDEDNAKKQKLKDDAEKKELRDRHRFSPNKTSAVYEKTSPRSDLRWKPTGRIFKSVGLRWIPTGKLFDSCTSKVDSEPPHGSNVDIPNIHECKQTLDVSAGTSINVQKEQSLDLSAVSTEVHQAAETVTTSNELDLLFGPLFDEYFNGENQVVLKSSAVTTTDASNKRQQQPDSTSSTSTLATTVTANGNFDLLVMSSHNVSSAVTYTTISSDSDRPSRGIPLMNAGELPEMDPYEEIEDQHYAADASPLTLSPGYIAESDQKEILEEDSEEDPIDYTADTDDDGEDEEEEESSDDDEEEEHLAHAVALSAVDLVPSVMETKPFETDESAATPPPPTAYQVSILFSLPTPPPSPLTPLSSPLPQIPSPPTHHPLPLPAPSTSRRADIPEAELPPRKRLLLIAPTPRFEIGESSTAVVARQPRSTMARRVDYVESVNLRDNYQAGVHRWESAEFQTRHQDVKDDRAALCDEVDTLRRHLSSLCTTLEQERVQARQALDRSEAHIRALEARIALEAGARIDTLVDTGSSA